MIKALCITLIILIGAISFSWAQGGEQKEDLQKAKDFYLKKIRSDSENTALHRELIELYKQKGLINIPIEIYKSSAEKFPENPTVAYVLGYAYLLNGTSESVKMAGEKLNLAIKLKSYFPDALAALGDYYFKTGQPELALVKWNEAIEIDDKSEPAYISLARFYRFRKEYEKAIGEYQKAASLSTNQIGKIYMELGLTYLDSGNLDKAEEILKRAKSYESKNGMIYYILGQVYAKRGNRDKAIDMYRDGRKYDPGNAQAAYDLAYIFLETNDTRYALLSMERGLSADGMDPKFAKELVTRIERGGAEGAIDYMCQLADYEYSNNFPLKYFLGKFYLKQKNDDLALKYLRAAAALPASNPDVHYQLGLIYEAKRKQEIPASTVKTDSQQQTTAMQIGSEDAKEQYRKAVDMGSSEAELLFKVAQGYLDEGQEGKFIEIAQKALIMNPNRADIHLKLAEIFSKRADIYTNNNQKEDEEKALTEAIKHYEQAVALEPDAQKWYNLGLLYERFGKSKAIKAVRAYEQAIQLNPDFAAAYYRMGRFRLSYKVGAAKVLMYKPEVAVEDLKKAIELDPKLADAHLSLGMAYHQMDMPEQATAEFEKTVELDPYNLKAHIFLAQDYALAGENQKVILHLSKAAELDSSNFEVLKALGGMLLKYGADKDVKSAREALEKAYKMKPDDAEVLMNYGYTLYLGSMFSNAVDKLKRALEIQPVYPEANYNIALAYSRIGEYQLAKQHWEKVIEQSPQTPLAEKAAEFLAKFKK